MSRSRSRKSALLEDSVALLVQHFGAEAVRKALARATSNGVEAEPQTPSRYGLFRDPKMTTPTITETLDLVRESDAEKYALLDTFYRQLTAGNVLPESQDIRQFTQRIGVKGVSGKSRKELVPRLMQRLVEQ